MQKMNIRLTPLNIVTFYACIGGIWIIFSCAKVFSSMYINKAAVTLLEVNSIVFILLTSWLLYFLIQKSEFDIKKRKKELGKPYRPLKATVVTSLVTRLQPC